MYMWQPVLPPDDYLDVVSLGARFDQTPTPIQQLG
jgi:hypothetical protein